MQNVKRDIAQYAKEFLMEHIRFDVVKKTILLPEVLSHYGADFGSKKSDLLRYALQILGPPFAARYNKFKENAKTEKVHLDYVSRDFTPLFSFSETYF